MLFEIDSSSRLWGLKSMPEDVVFVRGSSDARLSRGNDLVAVASVAELAKSSESRSTVTLDQGCPDPTCPLWVVPPIRTQ